MLIRWSILLGLACLFLVHCGPVQNTCTQKGTCTCPDGTEGERPCLESGRLGNCYCVVNPPPQEGTTRPEPPVRAERAGLERVLEPSLEPTPAEPTQEPPRREPPPGQEPNDPADASEPGLPETPQDLGATQEGTPEADGCKDPCPGELQCVKGQCVCPSSKSFCTNYCADLSYDPFHCGGCGKTCAADQACLNKKCQCFFSKQSVLHNFGCAVATMTTSPDGKYLIVMRDGVSTTCTADIRVWDWSTKKLVYEFKKVTYRYGPLFMHTDNDTLIRAGNYLYQYSIKQQKQLSVTYPPKGTSFRLFLSAPGTNTTEYIAGLSQSSGSTTKPLLAIYDLKTRRQVKKITDLPANPSAMTLRKDGKELAVSLANKEVQLWDTSTWKLRKQLKGLAAYPTSVAYNPAGDLLAVGLNNGHIELWNPSTGQRLRSIVFKSTFAYKVNQVAFTSDGKRVASAWADRTVKFHDVATGRLIHVLGDQRNEVKDLAFNKDGTSLATIAGTKVRLQSCQ